MEAQEYIDLDDLWDNTLTDLMEDAVYEELDSDVVESVVEVVET